MKRMPSAYKRSVYIREHRIYSPNTRQHFTYIHVRYNYQCFPPTIHNICCNYKTATVAPMRAKRIRNISKKMFVFFYVLL